MVIECLGPYRCILKDLAKVLLSFYESLFYFVLCSSVSFGWTWIWMTYYQCSAYTNQRRHYIKVFKISLLSCSNSLNCSENIIALKAKQRLQSEWQFSIHCKESVHFAGYYVGFHQIISEILFPHKGLRVSLKKQDLQLISRMLSCNFFFFSFSVCQQWFWWSLAYAIWTFSPVVDFIISNYVHEINVCFGSSVTPLQSWKILNINLRTLCRLCSANSLQVQQCPVNVSAMSGCLLFGSDSLYPWL